MGLQYPPNFPDRGILPGIKVDTGAKELANHEGEKITEGLDGLRERCSEYFAMGARFAKWRAVIRIDAGLPTKACISNECTCLGKVLSNLPGARASSYNRTRGSDGRRP